MKRSIAILMMFSMFALGSTGCLGRGAMGGSVGKFNLEVVENKWGRWIVFVLLGPVYGFASVSGACSLRAGGRRRFENRASARLGYPHRLERSRFPEELRVR